MTELDRLLRRIADGDDAVATLQRARALLRQDTRLPEDLREIGLDDDEPAIAASALLGVLGLDDGLFGSLLGEALQSEAFHDSPAPSLADEPVPELAPPETFAIPPRDAFDEPDVTAAMLDAQEAAGLPPVADAVRAMAGEIDVALSVLAAMGVNVVDVGAAVGALAGEVDISAAVATRLGALPEPVRAALDHEAGEAEVAAAVVAPLGEVLWPVAGAVRAEAGEVDLADAVSPLEVPVADAVRAAAGEIDLVDAVLAAIGAAEPALVADAVRDEAGDVQVWDRLAPAFEDGWVSGLLDHELPAVAHTIAARRLMGDAAASAELAAFADQGRSLRAAIREGAGETPYIWGEVAPRIGVADPEGVEGWDGSLVAEAIRAESGPVRIERGVMDRIERARQSELPLETPKPANNPGRWQWTGIALAAAVLLMVVVGRVVPLGGFGVTDASSAPSLDFAAAGEVSVEELSYDEDVDVIVTLPDEAGDRPLIIRINDEV